MKKRIFSLLTSLIMVISLVSVLPMMTVGAETSGDYEYEILDDGTVEITGYNGNGTNLTIPSTLGGKKVTSIGYYAFYGCKALTSIIIPDGVTQILSGTFSNCTNLTSIAIPDTVTSIGEEAFWGCLNLTSITIPDSVTTIGNKAFRGTSLTSITIPESVTVIGDDAFYSCSSLKSVSIPNSVKSIGDSAFAWCTSLTNITIPSSVTSIEGTFNKCSSLTSITIPNSVTTIGDYTFSGCTSLTSIAIPNSVTSIGKYAFNGCEGLTSIKIPNGVKSIGDHMFGSCSSLTRITIPNSVTTIGYYAFGYCYKLEKITIPHSVTSIEYGAFSDCYVNNIYFTGTQGQWSNISIADNNSRLNYANKHYNHVHSYTSTITKSATCQATGIKTFTCECGESYTATIPVTGHSYKLSVVAPTTTAQGYTLHKCSMCGTSYIDNYTDKLPDSVPVVTGFKVTATSAQAVRLSWNKVSGATGYVVYRASAGKWVRVGVVKTNSFYEGKLKSGTSYRYAVKAYKTVNGKNYYSPSYPTLWTSTNPATVSFTLTAGSKKATVKWSKVTGATGYKVYYKTSAKGKWIGLKTTTGTSYTKTGLTKGKTYYFTVKAYRTVNGKTYNGAFVTKSVKVK